MPITHDAIDAALSVKDYVITLLDADLNEEFQERAAIIQFSAHLTRNHAECLALLDVLRRHKLKLMIIK